MNTDVAGWRLLLLAAPGPGGVDYVNLILALSGVLLVLCVAAGTVVGLRRWWQKQRQEEPHSASTLADFRALHEQGELTGEELERIRGVVAEPPSAAPPTGGPRNA